MTNAAIENLASAFFHALKPPAKLSLSQWADQFAVLSAESSAEVGRWHTLPYQREMMDEITDPSVTMVTVMKSARVGYTKILNHVIGYHIHQDPCSMMLVQPTVEDAEGYSKEEIAPMIRDTPVLAGLVSDAKAKDGGNTILQKMFPGGTLSLIGANSPRGFRRVSRRVVLFDEVDGYPTGGAGTEGDQIKLGIRRSEYFWNRKIVAGSTPLLKDSSRIERLFGQSDQRRYFVPCPECGSMQYLKWPNLKWPEGEPHLAYFVCEQNGCVMPHQKKRWMVERGEWRATAQGAPGHVGFHIWAAYSYSPNASWGQLAAEFLEAKDDTETLKTFVNTVLGETWEEEYSKKIGADALEKRAETYDPAVAPTKVLCLTAGVDVQDNRLEVTVYGWAGGEESWALQHMQIFGDPGQAEVWKQLDDVIFRPYRHESGAELKIMATAIDSGGHFTHEVYQYARARRTRGVIAVKGSSIMGKPAIGKPSKQDINFRGQTLKRGVDLYPVGSDTVKATLYRRLRNSNPGPGYVHFHAGLGPEFFKQLTSEKLVTRHTKTGVAVKEFTKKPGTRNEALDCAVYAFAALQWLYTRYRRATFWTQLEEALGRKGVPVPADPPTGEAPAEPGEKLPAPTEGNLKKDRPARTMPKRGRGGFVSNW